MSEQPLPAASLTAPYSPTTPIFDSDERTDAAKRYLHGLTPEDAVLHPGYQALGEALSESELALDLLCSVPLEQRNSMLILAALHFAALSGHPTLGPLYRALGTTAPCAPEQFAREVLEVLEADPSVVRHQLHRQTQTNEVGRSAVLRAVVSELGRRGVSGLNLVDIGTSAGLNLYLDQYRVSPVPVADPLTLVCESLNGVLDEGTFPTVHSRVGVDRNPLDLRVADDALWLRACLWPENPSRLRRLQRIEQQIPKWPAINLLRGDALERLDDALALGDPSVPTVVMHTWVAAYFAPELQRSFAAALRERVARGDLYWLYLEWPRAVAGLDPPSPRSPAPRPGASQIVVAEPGGLPAHWGWCHAHGRWLSLELPPGP